MEEELVIRKKGKKLLPKYISTRPLEQQVRKFNREHFAPDLKPMLLRREKSPSTVLVDRMLKDFQPTPAVTKDPAPSQQVFDLWATPAPAQAEPRPTPAVKALILPSSGQSYNPAVEDYEALVKQVVEQEEAKTRKVRKQKVVRSLKKKIVKARNQRRRAQQLEARRRKEQAERVSQMQNFQNLVRQAQNIQRKAQAKEQANKVAARRRQRLAREQGVVQKGPLMGGRRYESRGKDVLPVQEMPSSLRVVTNRPGVVLDRYQSIMRRGMSEVLDVGRKKQKPKFKKFKVVERLGVK